LVFTLHEGCEETVVIGDVREIRQGLNYGATWSVHYGGACEVRYHLVWCPRYRRKVLVGPIADRLAALLRETLAESGGEAVDLAVQPDHLHLFVRMDKPYWFPAQIVHRLKGATSRALRAEFPELRRRLPCLRSQSYYIGTVGHVSRAPARHPPFQDPEPIPVRISPALQELTRQLAARPH
jgi:putative transposase